MDFAEDNELRPPNPPVEIVASYHGSRVIFNCDVCGKECSVRKSHYDNKKYHYCSRKCSFEHKKIRFKGHHNHQYGLRGPLNDSFKDAEITKVNNRLTENLIYVGEWYQRSIHSGRRIPKHRFLVEQNWEHYNPEFFIEIDGWHYLNKGIEVHHIDFDHNNNDISNLQPMTKSEHISLHNRHRSKKRCSNEKFVKEHDS